MGPTSQVTGKEMAEDRDNARRLRSRPGSRTRTIEPVLVVVALAIITFLHLYTTPSLESLHHLYRRLYYLPILYAGFTYGIRGGLLTAVAAGILLMPTVFAPEAAGYEVGVAEIGMYLLVGALFGWLRDQESGKKKGLRRVTTQLEEAYSKLEERAVELVTVQEYTDSILQSITSAVLTVSAEGSVATANTAAERMLGVPEEDMVPRPIRQLMTDDGGLGEEIKKVLEGRVPRTVREASIVTLDGEQIQAQVSVSRMQDLDLRVLGAVVTIDDLSEVKALTAQLIRSDRLAALGELTAGVAHEVRNPLGIIRAAVQLLEEEAYDPGRAREAGSRINQEVDRLDSVVKALLDFGRPSSPALVRVSVNRLLEEVVLFIRKWAGRSGVDIVVHYAEELPFVRQ